MALRPLLTCDVLDCSVDDAINLAELSSFDHSLPAFRIIFEPSPHFPNSYSFARHLRKNPLRQNFYLPFTSVIALTLPDSEFVKDLLPGDRWLDSKFLRYVLRCFPNLRGLILDSDTDHTFRLTIKQIRQLVDGMPNMRHLDLDGFPHRDNILKEWGRLKNLQHLRIDSHGYEDLKRLDVNGLVLALPRLRRLRLLNSTDSVIDLHEADIIAIRAEADNSMTD